MHEQLLVLHVLVVLVLHENELPFILLFAVLPLLQIVLCLLLPLLLQVLVLLLIVLLQHLGLMLPNQLHLFKLPLKGLNTVLLGTDQLVAADRHDGWRCSAGSASHAEGSWPMLDSKLRSNSGSVCRRTGVLTA